MYKKIVHNIVEEHYDHPATLPNGVGYGFTASGKAPIVKTESSKATTVLKYTSPEEIQLIKDAIIGWAQYNWRIRSLVISITEGDKDIDLLKARLTKDIAYLGQLVSSVYSDEGAKKFDQLLGQATMTLVDLIAAIRADSSRKINELKTQWTDDVTKLSEFLASVNTAWPAKAVSDIFNTVGELYIQQAQHRIAKEWAAGVDAADRAYDIMVNKQPNGSSSFADIFSSGLIAAKK